MEDDKRIEILQRALFQLDKEKDHYLMLCPNYLLCKLDLTGVSWDNVDVRNVDFRNCQGIMLDPQKVYNKDLSNVLADENTSIIDDFNEVILMNANINNCNLVSKYKIR